MPTETLNLAYHEKRLITLALIKAKGNITEAYRMNVPNGLFMTYKTYLHKINHVHKIDTNTIKEKCKQKPCGA